MALVFMEGAETFEAGGSFLDVDDDLRVKETTGQLGISTDTRYSGGQSLSVYSNTADLKFNYDQTIAGGATWFCGAAIKLNSISTVDRALIEWNTDFSPGTVKNAVYMQATTGDLLFKRGTTTIHELSGADGFTAAQWDYWVFKVKDDPTTGTLEIWRNGTKLADVTSLNTGDGSTAYTTISFKSQTIVFAYYDDIYVGDTTGSDLTDQVGEVRMELVSPNANGTTNNFTASPAVANYLNVDDGTTNDGDTSYNHSSTATHKDLYATANLTGDVDTVYAVQVHARVRVAYAAVRTANIVCRSSVTEVDGTTFDMGSTSYKVATEIYENDPNGGINWTEASANSAEIGIKIAS